MSEKERRPRREVLKDATTDLGYEVIRIRRKFSLTPVEALMAVHLVEGVLADEFFRAEQVALSGRKPEKASGA